MTLLFIPFKQDIIGIKKPDKFTYPFNYLPHQLTVIASQQLQDYLENQTQWIHNFGFNSEKSNTATGKMFGVLVCENIKGELGQLWAFSGKLANKNEWSYFVPTVFDMLTQEGFYKKGETLLNKYNTKIKQLLNNSQYQSLLQKKKAIIEESQHAILNQKERIKELKRTRKLKRKEVLKEALSKEITNELLFEFNEESKKENIILKKMKKYWQQKLEANSNELVIYENKINSLKQIRKQKSAALQQQLFKEYAFLNIKGENKSIDEIFDSTPPAGAGECCAPKLLHYAFLHKLKPIAMAEFWWGKSPSSKIRKHKYFYPSCRSKCEPILMKHMLKGLKVAPNPLEIDKTDTKEIEIVYDDRWISVINKPHNLLSVPGKRIKDSVYTRIKKLYPKASGPLLVHRLDRATSGLLVIAKDLETYIDLQKQFTNRSVKKRYMAWLNGVVDTPKGVIDLPLRVDLDNRPQQLVCYEYGKKAITQYEVLEVNNQKTKVYFYPITGRTHQLRIHSSHPKGLNIPIVGDDLYGIPSDRLELYAEWIQFKHPKNKKTINFSINS